MDFYTIFKFLHVLTAIAWVGGGMTLLASSIVTMRTQGDEAVLKSLETMNSLGKIWFIPASLLTVIFGAIATTLGGLWGDMWVVLGLVGFASTFLTGLLFIEPKGRQVATLIEAGNMQAAIAEGRKLLNVAKFDYTVMLLIVADMVLKPVWTDFAIIAVFAVVLVVGFLVFMVPALRSEPEAVAA
jgi:uncharacterized membrane protein